MRIVLASSAMGGGGAQKAAVNLAAYFARTGHDVAYFHWGAEDYGGRESMPGVDIVRPSRDGFLSRLFALASLVRKRRPDVVFGFTDVPNVLAFLACRLAASGARVVPGIHSDLRQRDAEVRQGLAERALRVLHRIACRNASAVVAVSGEARRSLIEYYGLPPQRVHGIYNPVLRSVGAATARAGGRGADLVAVGRLTAAKDYPLMIRAVAELVRRGLPVRLTIFGEGEERASLERLVAALDLGDRIAFAGFHADVQSRLSRFDLFLMTSRWEGFGIALVEALDAGLAVVSTDCPSGPAEILADGRFGTLVRDATPERIADAVAAALASAGGDRPTDALATHLAQFSIARVGEEYLRLARDGQGAA